MVMPTKRPSPPEQLPSNGTELAIACLKCGAKAGRRCKRSDGKVESHNSRIKDRCCARQSGSIVREHHPPKAPLWSGFECAKDPAPAARAAYRAGDERGLIRARGIEPAQQALSAIRRGAPLSHDQFPTVFR